MGTIDVGSEESSLKKVSWLSPHTGYSSLQQIKGMAEQERQAEKAEKYQIKAQKFADSIYETGKSDLENYVEAGQWGAKELKKRVKAGPGEYSLSDDYTYNLGRMEKLQKAQASSSGNLGSGMSIRNRLASTQELGMQDYTNFMQRYYDSLSPFQTLANMGQSAATMQGTYSTGYAGMQQATAGALSNIYSQSAQNQTEGLTRMGNMGTNMAQNITTAVNAYS